MNIIMEQDGLATVLLNSTVMTSDEVMWKEGMMQDIGMEAAPAKGSVMSSWVFVIGITVATLAISIVLGVLLAKKRIKKGLNLYED